MKTEVRNRVHDLLVKVSELGESVYFEIPEIKISLLNEDAGITGASFLATESLLMGEFPYKIEQEVLT